MAKDNRVVTANLPLVLASRLDEAARRTDRSRSWIIRQALAEWLAEEDRRYELTWEALKDGDEGRLLTTDEVAGHFASRRAQRARRQA